MWFIGSELIGRFSQAVMLKNIVIRLPSSEKQTEIANHINALRVQAKALQQQATTELEPAKQQVERMILGD
jgi:type I restriction enzyme, S subunit